MGETLERHPFSGLVHSADDRFARQNRSGLPPEFPLASSCSGIVHHLSGPAPYALTQIHPRTSGSVDDAPKLSPAFTFITRRGLTPEHSHTKTTPWSVFQDGSLMTITPASLQMREPQSPPGAAFPNYSTRRRNFTEIWHPTRRGSHPLWRPVPGNSEGTASKRVIKKLGFNGVAATITSNEGFTTTLWKLDVTANQFGERDLTRESQHQAGLEG
ncbi:hypothetical protein Ddc_18903 [Ditylenchus destructor]|nr:hypothetical protein Ddc_18903 [Ditylenchus destructor]